MSHTIKAVFTRTIICDRCNAVEEVVSEGPSENRSVVNSANDAQTATSPGFTNVSVISLRTGWAGSYQGSSPVRVGHGIDWHGDLCQSCAETLTELVRKFLADGIQGMVQLAKEEEEVEDTNIPF